MDEIKGWHSRGYLPHFDSPNKTQFVTIRLHDSLPNAVLDPLTSWQHIHQKRQIENLELQRTIEKFLDRGHGKCYLGNPNVARIVEEKLQDLDGEKYKLEAWVIMPNHVHFLITPVPGHSLTRIMQLIKGATAREANLFLQREGKFWMQDYFDRFIRDQAHFSKAVAYIENNPVKAGLCSQPSEWRFSSAWNTERGL